MAELLLKKREKKNTVNVYLRHPRYTQCVRRIQTIRILQHQCQQPRFLSPTREQVPGDKDKKKGM